MKDELEYYIEANLEDDFMENDELYDEFDFTSAPDSDSDSDFSDDDPRKNYHSSIITKIYFIFYFSIKEEIT